MHGTPVIHYYGWDILFFWIRQAENYFAEYSWQVRIAYLILVVSICMMILLSILFGRHMYKRSKQDKKLEKCSKLYADKFREILDSDVQMDEHDVEVVCGCRKEKFRKFSGEVFARLICSLRMEINDRLLVPNVQLLCDITGVSKYVEMNLKQEKNVTQTMQLITTLPLMVSEGLLATYINHRNLRIKNMAHIAYSVCTNNNPYRYLKDDLNERLALWRPMTLHRLFGWLRANGRQMPPFIIIANELTNPRMAAFMIEEVAYWGNEQEKSSLTQFLRADKKSNRKAAIRAIAMIYGSATTNIPVNSNEDIVTNADYFPSSSYFDPAKKSKDKGQYANLMRQTYDQYPEVVARIEDQIIATYQDQPTDVRFEALKTIYALNTGRQVNFFEKVYLTAPSKTNAELALTCLYDYSAEGRRRFEELRNAPLNTRSHHLFEQIDSLGKLYRLREQYQENQ